MGVIRVFLGRDLIAASRLSNCQHHEQHVSPKAVATEKKVNGRASVALLLLPTSYRTIPILGPGYTVAKSTLFDTLEPSVSAP